MSGTKFFLLCLLVVALSSLSSASDNNLYTYRVGNVTKTTNKSLTVHVIAHTHCDPGWLKTFDEYYVGARNDIYWAGVRYIIDAVIQELNHHPDRKFILVEISFFSRWWKEQNQQTKMLVNKLLENGQLEFISGGWVMHDEAASYYEDQIDNMAVGHQFLKDTFNINPKIGWQIDPFGHSATTASFFSKMGFEGYWFARPDYQNKAQRLATKSMEMIWTPNTSQGEENQIWSAFTYNEYASPRGFCYDALFCQDEPVITDPTMELYNVEQKVIDITNYFRIMSEGYQSEHLIHTWGEDFQFQAANSYFKNLDTLIEETNNRFEKYGVKLVYSTPSQYLKAIQSQNLTFPKNTDDFFPYADHPNAFWTGYFTSRVSQKGHTRHTGRLFQNIRRMISQKLASGKSNYLKKHLKAVLEVLASAEQNRGLLQHHDAVAGTARHRVKEDYVYRMEKSMNELHQVATNNLLKEETRAALGIETNFTSCLLNTTAEACQINQNLAQNKSLLVAVHNTVQERDQVVRIKVTQTNIQVVTMSKARGMVNLDTDIICSNRTSSKDCDLYFFDHFNASSTQFYLLKSVNYSNEVVGSYNNHPLTTEEVVHISANRSIKMVGDRTDFIIIENNKTHRFKLRMNYYPSYCTTTDQNSGAYIFRPQNNSLNGSSPYTSVSVTGVFKGKVVSQVSVHYEKAIMNLRFEVNQSSLPGVEMETFIDSIDIEDGVGKEIVMVIDVPEIDSGDIWYTDSNGQEMQRRKRNYRSTWNLTTDQISSSNYYPVTSAISIQDNSTGARFTLLTDRAHGGTSLQSSQIELMLHRRMICDDRRGVVEPLNETDYDGKGLRQWFTQRIIFSNSSNEQRSAQYLLDQPLMVYTALHNETFEFYSVRKTKDNVLAANLPKNVKINVKPYSETEFVIWVHNMNEFDVTVPTTSLGDYLTDGVSQPKYQELSLSANQVKSEMVQRKPTWNGVEHPTFNARHEEIKDGIQLRSLEIRCFRINIQRERI